jgi:hypothetical protein
MSASPSSLGARCGSRFSTASVPFLVYIGPSGTRAIFTRSEPRLRLQAPPLPLPAPAPPPPPAPPRNLSLWPSPTLRSTTPPPRNTHRLRTRLSYLSSDCTLTTCTGFAVRARPRATVSSAGSSAPGSASHARSCARARAAERRSSRATLSCSASHAGGASWLPEPVFTPARSASALASQARPQSHSLDADHSAPLFAYHSRPSDLAHQHQHSIRNSLVSCATHTIRLPYPFLGHSSSCTASLSCICIISPAYVQYTSIET